MVERYLVGRTQVDLAAEHGVSASMMSRKVAAAVEELRSRLQSKGFTAAVGTLTTGFAVESVAGVPATLGAELVKIGVAGVSGVAAAGGGGTVVAAAGGGGASAGLIVVGVFGGVLLVVATVIVVAVLLLYNFIAIAVGPNKRLDPVTDHAAAQRAGVRGTFDRPAARGAQRGDQRFDGPGREKPAGRQRAAAGRVGGGGF